MTPFLFFFSASLIALIIASYTDLKQRIVSDKLTYGMMAIGLIGYLVLGFLESNFFLFFNSVIAAVAAFLFSLLLYKAGVWAGGDVKLFTGIAALNPVNPNILGRLGVLSIPLFAAIELPIFFLTLFIFSLFAMLPYGVFLALGRLHRDKKHGKKIMRQLLFFGIGFVVIAALNCYAFLNKNDALFQLLLPIAAIWLVYFLLKLYGMSKVLMRKAIRISDLQEGMIVGETIVESAGKAERAPEKGIKNLINYFVANRSSKTVQQREIVSSARAGGVTVEEIKELQKLVKEGKLQDAIMVKESAAMVPAVLIAYIVLNVVGDLIWVFAR